MNIADTIFKLIYILTKTHKHMNYSLTGYNYEDENDYLL